LARRCRSPTRACAPPASTTLRGSHGAHDPARRLSDRLALHDLLPDWQRRAAADHHHDDTRETAPAFGRSGIIQGLPSNRVCLSKRHFTIHIRRYPGISYVEAIVFVNRHTVSVTRSRSGQFSVPIDLRGLSAGTFPVKITVITTTGSIISGTRSYKTCHKKVGSTDPAASDLSARSVSTEATEI